MLMISYNLTSWSDPAALNFILIQNQAKRFTADWLTLTLLYDLFSQIIIQNSESLFGEQLVIDY